MKTTPENQKLFDLINDARTGKIVLPQFQRNFVWSRDEITELLVSILQGHFIGSFLLLNCDKDNVPFAIRSLEGIDLSGIQLKPDVMILDGQQRLTSLNYVFSAPNIPLRWTKYPYRFYLDLNKVMNGEIENSVISERRLNGEIGILDIREEQYKKLVIPFTEIENWSMWQNDYEKWLVDKDKDFYFDTYFQKYKPKWTVVADRLRNFVVPTIAIPKFKEDDPQALGEVCAIFEKINTTGVKLSVYDLLTARLYKYKIDLHSLWQGTVDTYHLIDVFSEGIPDDFGVYILRIISLIRGLDAKSKTLIGLSPVSFEQDWKIATAYAEKALLRMTAVDADGFGAFDKRWMPYMTMVSPLAAMLHNIEANKLGHEAYKVMRRWYWSAVFRERFAGAVESSISKDYQDFTKAVVSVDFTPDAIHDALVNIVENPAFSLKDVSRLNSLYKGVICLIGLRGAKDFSADDSIKFHTLEDHHIFPYAYLNKITVEHKYMYSKDQMNCVINRTLIADQTNKRILNKKPSQYLIDVVPAKRSNEILKTHFITDLAYQAMLDNDYERFSNEREKLLIEEIRHLIRD